MTTLAITGATGAIGVRLCKIACSQGYKVIALVRRNSKNISKLTGLPVTIVECNSDEYKTFQPQHRADAFIHLAWEGPDVSYRDNVQMQLDNLNDTLGAVELAKRMQCTTFVFATSQAEVGRCDGVITASTPPFPESGYGVTKYAAGMLSRLRCEQLEMRHCRARILSVFGEDDDDARLLNYVAKTLLAGGIPSLTPCEQMWDFVYIDEACRQLCLIAQEGKDGAVYQVCSGVERPIREYIEMIRDEIDPSLPLGFGEKQYYPHQPMRLVGDLSPLKADTGYIPDEDMLKIGISRVVDRYRKMQSADEGRQLL